MVKIFVLVALFSVFYSTSALDGHFSPVLFFKNKENTKPFAKNGISSTTPVDQREFERRLSTLDQDQKVVFCVARDLSPEAFAKRNEEKTKAFENIASKVEILEYSPNVENPVENKVTKAKNVARVSVSLTNEFEPTPSSDARIIIAALPEYHDAESEFHYLARIDRACYAISQQDEYKDALFVLTSETNSHLQSHLRKARDTGAQKADSKGIVKKDANFIVYLTDFIERKGTTDTIITIGESDITGSKPDDSTIEIKFKDKLTLEFKLNKETEYWYLEKALPNVSQSQIPQIFVPKEFSYSCSSTLYFPTSDKDGLYFKNFQIQLNFDSSFDQNKFASSYDCIGFTSAGIWSGLFITFLLLAIVGLGITYIMDIRTMDRFDDPKGKTITVNASD